MTHRTAIVAADFLVAALLCALTILPAADAAPPPPPPLVQMDYGKAWVPEGPGQIQNGQVEGATVTNGLVRGALHTVTAHPTNPDIVHVGAVHGGIWRTTDATAPVPTWTNVTPGIGQQAIAAMEYDPSNSNVMLAGHGYMSSFGQAGDVRVGNLQRSTDGGATWTAITNLPVPGSNIVSVKARGPVLIAASNGFFGTPAGALFRSPDTGATWATISGGGGTGLPPGGVSDVVGDPSNNNVLYCGLPRGLAVAAGVYRSIDSGATWVNIATAAIDPALNAAVSNVGCFNIEMAVGPTSRLWVIVTLNGQANYIGYTSNPGAAAPTWVQMDLPLTPDAGGLDGLQPRAKPGGQGATHLSIVADPNNANLVYIGGDRQPAAAGGPPSFPNSIGANDFSGRLFRGDSTQAATGRGAALPDVAFSPQWAHLTNVAGLGWAAGGTASNSSPHADSREMVFDANGNIIEVDDGGIYRRSSPQNNMGDWFDLAGNLQVTEAHDMVYDTVSDIIVTGNQDVGTTHQTAPGSLVWTSMSFLPMFSGFRTGDGGDCGVDPTSTPGSSLRYNSFQRLSAFGFQTYNAAGVPTAGTVFPALAIGGNTLCSGNPAGPAGCFGAPQFKTPVEINTVVGSEIRFVVGMGNDCYESVDQGATIVALGIGGGVNRPGALAYGAGGNPEALYIGSGGTVFVRMAAGLPAPTPTLYPGASANDIVMDPTNPMRAFFADANGAVYQTTDAGTTWSNITGDLLTAAGGAVDLRAIEYVTTGGGDDSVLVGSTTGVYGVQVSTLPPNPGPIAWNLVGTGLPEARVWEIDYDPVDDVLVVATLGRGTFSISALLTPSDVTPPVLTTGLLRTILWPASRGLLPVGLTASATDDQPPAPIVTVTVYSDEPAGAPPYAPDAIGTAPADTRLRAERAYPWAPGFPGDAPGRVYLVRVDAFDGAGNVATQVRSAIVPLVPTTMSIMTLQAQALAGEAACLAIPAVPGVPTADPAGYNQALCYVAP